MQSRWKDRLVWIVVAAFFGGLFGALFSVGVPRLYDAFQEKHPDTRIYQMVTQDGPWILVENRGEAPDRIRIDISVEPDHIEDWSVSDEAVVKIAMGGVGETYVKFIIDELWPGISQHILINTSATVKIGAFVQGYSLSKGDIEEEIPVVTVK